MSDPVPVPEDNADFECVPRLDGGLAFDDAAELLDVVLDVNDLDEADFTGEYDAWAELGRSGTPFAAASFALLCSAIFSFKAMRAALPPALGPTDLENEEVLFIDEVKDALGLFGSFSNAFRSRASSVFIILSQVN